MARGSSKAKKKGRADEGEESRSWAASLGSMVGLGPRLWIALSGAILLAAMLLPSLLGEDFDQRFVVEPRRLSFDLEPVWLEEPARAEVREAVAGMEPVSLRDDEALAEWVTELEARTPWIASVRDPRKAYPRRLSFSLDLRRPVARVQTTEGRLLVDAEGTVLGPEDLSPAYVKKERPLVIFQRDAKFRFAPGERIEHAPLLAGLEVVKELIPHLSGLRQDGCDLVLVDVTPMAEAKRDRRTDVKLYTAEGRSVEWGRPRSLRADEPTAETKVQNLRFAMREAPPFEEVLGYAVQFSLRRQVSVIRDTGLRQVAAGGSIVDPYTRDRAGREN